MRVRVRTVALPMWGTIRQLGAVASGWSAGMGSGSVTSNPAAAMVPSAKASAKAAASTTGPREALTRVAVGFIRRRASPSIRCRVSGVNPTRTAT